MTVHSGDARRAVIKDMLEYKTVRQKRRTIAANAHALGFTYREIAKHMGIYIGTGSRWVREHYAKSE